MSDIKPYPNFDFWLAVQKGNFELIRLNYGLIPTRNITAERNQNSDSFGSDKNDFPWPHLDWQNINRVIMKASVTLGAFVSLN